LQVDATGRKGKPVNSSCGIPVAAGIQMNEQAGPRLSPG
jgi:hypothetical protein